MLTIFIIINYYNIPMDETTSVHVGNNFNSRDWSFDVWIDILFNLWDRKVAIKFPKYEDRRFCRDSFAIFDLRISCTVSFNLIHVAQVWQAYFYKTGILQLIWSR